MDATWTTDGLYTDRYELAMAAAHWREGRADEPAVFDYFFRNTPFKGGYAVFAGLGTLLDCLGRFRFGPETVDFLEREGMPAGFLEYLRNFSFKGSIWAAAEGEVVFPHEPVVRVEGGLVETQIIETLLLNVLNFQTLVATKAARCRHAAGNRSLSEFGLRRAQGLGGIWASRAAFIGGCDSTSNLAAARAYGIPAAGTIAHSYIQSHESEIDAFRSYAATHGSATVLLLDTYDTLRSGLPNAITVSRELASRGESLAGVRLDSGDFAYLSRHVRTGLDAAGLADVRIVASNQLDEFLIRSLLLQGAAIDVFGVGTSLVTGAPDAALDGVYKLAVIRGRPCLKLSDNVTKASLPGRKQVTRFRNGDGMFMADAIHLEGEDDIPLMIHPFDSRRRLQLGSHTGQPLLAPVMAEGRLVRRLQSLADSAAHARAQLRQLADEYHRFENPHVYKVGLSRPLCDLRDDLLESRLREIPSS